MDTLQLLTILRAAETALLHSKPVMSHYPEPVEQHSAAYRLVQLAVIRLERGDLIENSPELGSRPAEACARDALYS